MSDKDKNHGKSRRTTQPATVPGAFATPPLEEPSEAEVRPRAPAPPRNDTPPPRRLPTNNMSVERGESGGVKGRRTAAIVPGAVAVPVPVETQEPDVADTAHAATTSPPGASLSPDSGASRSSRSSKKSRRTTKPATMPGAVAVPAQEPDPTLLLSTFSAHSVEGSGQHRSDTNVTNSTTATLQRKIDSPTNKKGRRSKPAKTPGAVHVAGAAIQTKEANVEEDEMVVAGGTNEMATHVYAEQEHETNNMQSGGNIIQRATMGRDTSTSSVPGAVAVDGLMAVQSIEEDMAAKKQAADAARNEGGISVPGAQPVVSTAAEQADTAALRKDPRARHGRQGRRNRDATARQAAVGATDAEVATLIANDDYQRSLEKTRDAENQSLGVKDDNASTSDNKNYAEAEEGEDEDKGPFEDDPSNDITPVVTQPPVVTTADRGDTVAPDVQHGTMDGTFAGPGRRAENEDFPIAVAVEDIEDEYWNYLPVGVEYDPDAKPPILKNVRFRFYASLIILMFVIVIVSVVLGTVVFKPDAPARETYAPTVLPSNPPSTTTDGAYRAVVETKVGANVFIGGTPQDRAAQWIIEEDPLQLSVNDEIRLLQRYLLAFFYFSTTNNGERPWRSCNPPDPGSNETICDLYKFVRNMDDSISYVPEQSVRWLSSAHECEWAGNLCDENNVTRALDLIGQNITGTLPTELASFDYLQSISLAYNALSGTLPTEYGSMRLLLNLELHGNLLTGSIPDIYYEATSLQNLNIGDNYLTGTLSSEIGRLSNLKGMQTFQNFFTGSFPFEVTELRFLSFSRNHENAWTGTIPTEFGQLTLLQELWMYSNHFSGTLPTELGRLTDMMDLRFYENRLTGTIPTELYSLGFLFRLDLFSNFFTGTLSNQIGNFLEMEQFRVSRNKLTGTIPTEIGSMTKLQLGWFHVNGFTGSMPALVCALRPYPLQYMQADCFPEGNEPNPCPCCTACCNRETEICQIIEYYG